MTRNVVRVAIIAWLAISVWTGLRSWTDHEVPVIVAVPVTAENLSGLETKQADFRCPAPIAGDGSPVMLDEVPNFRQPAREPCEPYLRGRQLLFGVDIVAGIGALALTFARVTRRRVRRAARRGSEPVPPL